MTSRSDGPLERPSIFRPRALAVWIERRDRSVVPRLGAPRVLIALWGALAVLAAAGAAVLVLLLREIG